MNVNMWQQTCCYWLNFSSRVSSHNPETEAIIHFFPMETEQFILIFVWFRSISLLFVNQFLRFNFFFSSTLEVRNPSFELLSMSKSRVLSIDEKLSANPKTSFAEFWRNTKLFAQNIVLRFICRVYPNHLKLSFWGSFLSFGS